MKNTGKGILIGAIAGTFLFSAFAFNLVSPSESISKGLDYKEVVGSERLPEGEVHFVLGDDTYARIEVSALPQAVRSAAMTRYVAYSITEAFRDHDDIYKLVLKSGNGNMITYYNGVGEHLGQETIKSVQIVALN